MHEYTAELGATIEPFTIVIGAVVPFTCTKQIKLLLPLGSPTFITPTVSAVPLTLGTSAVKLPFIVPLPVGHVHVRCTGVPDTLYTLHVLVPAEAVNHNVVVGAAMVSVIGATVSGSVFPLVSIALRLENVKTSVPNGADGDISNGIVATRLEVNGTMVAGSCVASVHTLFGPLAHVMILLIVATSSLRTGSDTVVLAGEFNCHRSETTLCGTPLKASRRLRVFPGEAEGALKPVVSVCAKLHSARKSREQTIFIYGFLVFTSFMSLPSGEATNRVPSLRST